MSITSVSRTAAAVLRWRPLPEWRSRGAPRALVGVAAATVLAVNLPLVYLFVRSSAGGWQGYLSSVLAPSTGALLTRTLALVAGVALVTVPLAVSMAWLVTRTDLPGRRLWALAGALPLVFPSYVAAFCWVAVLGPRGYLRSWLAPLGVERLPEWVYGYPGALLVLGLYTYPYTYLLVLAALRRLDPALEESSRSLGRGRWWTFWHVILPQLRSPIYAGTLLVILYTLADFGAVSILRYNTFTVSIYNAYRSLLDRTTAASLSTVLVLLTLACIALEAWLLRGLRPVPGRPDRPARAVPLGRWRGLSVTGLVLFALLSLGIPVGVVGYWGLRALWLGKSLGTTWHLALSSVGVSALAAGAAVLLALPVTAWAVRYPSPLSRLSERLAHAGYALPGIVVALALVFVSTHHLGAIYQTLPLLVAAYVVRFLPEALAAARSSLLAVAPRFEEAARSLGRGPVEVLRSLTMPLMKPGLMAGAGLVFLTAMKELPATLILRPIGFETLAIRIWSAASEGIFSEAALPALSLVAASALPVYLFVLRPSLATRSGDE